MKTKYIITLLLLATTLFTACSNDDGYNPDKDAVPVQFTSGISVKSQAKVAGSSWENNDKVGIFMVKHGQSLSAANISNGADNRLYISNTSGTFTPSSTPTDQTIFYPGSGEKVDFVAYYPYQSPLSGYIYQVNVANQGNPAAIDLLYSTANNGGVGYDKTSSTVAMPFTHKLSKLTINIAIGTGLTAADLTGMTISINGLSTTADFNLANGTFSNLGTVAAITPKEITAASQYQAIVIPQNGVAGNKVRFTLSGIGYFDWDMSAINFASGNNYNYTITINRTHITVGPCTITDWTKETEQNIGTGYKIGDYYPNPVNKNTAIGLVIQVDPVDNRHGKIVSLDEGPTIWGPLNEVTGADDLNDGRVNMATMWAFDNGYTNHKAFQWVYMVKNNSDVNGEWYLPAREEIRAMYAGFSGLNLGTEIQSWGTYSAMPGLRSWDDPAEKTKIQTAQAYFNSQLVAAGGMGFVSDKYWSSTEDSEDLAYIIETANGNIAPTYGFGDIKPNMNGVRAIRIF